MSHIETQKMFLVSVVSSHQLEGNPKKAVEERQMKHPQDSIAEAEIVPAPPRTKDTDVTINSARNTTPPELPTRLPMIRNAITTVFNEKGENIDRLFVFLSSEGPRPVSIHCSDRLMPSPMLEQNTVIRFKKKCGDEAVKLPRAIKTPAANF